MRARCVGKVCVSVSVSVWVYEIVVVRNLKGNQDGYLKKTCMHARTSPTQHTQNLWAKTKSVKPSYVLEYSLNNGGAQLLALGQFFVS